MNFKRAKGCYDIVPHPQEAWKDSSVWQWLEAQLHRFCSLYHFEEVRPPLFEATELFTRSVGQGTDIVTKEMYTFEDKGGRSLTLRPEMTASAIRCFLENGLHTTKHHRIYYISNCFRYERAQQGRYRQFAQFGIEVLGESGPASDAETIAMLLHLYETLGLKNLVLHINTLGNLEARQRYIQALRTFLKEKQQNLSADSQRRLQVNPLRILDSKAPEDREVIQKGPQLSEFLSKEASTHFQAVCDILDDLSLPYEKNAHLVRGLDYYCDTVFEVIAKDDTAAQNTIGAGGRYDGLVKGLGGPDLAGIGFATGLERVLQNLVQQQALPPMEHHPKWYFIPLTDSAQPLLLRIMQSVRKRNQSALCHPKVVNAKKGLQAAVHKEAKFAALIGDTEMAQGTITVKELATRKEQTLPLKELINQL